MPKPSGVSPDPACSRAVSFRVSAAVCQRLREGQAQFPSPNPPHLWRKHLKWPTGTGLWPGFPGSSQTHPEPRRPLRLPEAGSPGPHVRPSRSLALSSLSRHAEAVAYYKKALELDPDNETYRSNLKIAELKLREAPSPVSPGGCGVGRGQAGPVVARAPGLVRVSLGRGEAS